MKDESNCADCKKFCLKDGDYYMVTDKLWKLFGCGVGLLCLGCFKKRLGREFIPGDFIKASVNRTNPFVRKIMRKKTK